MAVRFLDPHHPSPNKLETFTGICLEVRRLGQWGGSFTLRNNLNGYAVEQQFPFWSPLIKVCHIHHAPHTTHHTHHNPCTIHHTLYNLAYIP